jgi:formylglycine-generating enzyme required for sulfatase activity
VAQILDYIRLSNCRNVGLILDCCYSGAVGDSIFKGGLEEQLQQASSSGGVYILTASTAVQVAEEKEKDEYGLLTKYIIQGIESGDADLKEDGQISMDGLYEYVHRKVKQEGFQEPMKWDLQVTGELIVARSGRMPREERRKQIRQMMLDYAREGQISDSLLSEALKVLKLRPDELHGEPRRRDDLLRRLLDRRLPLGEFMDEWYAPPPIGPVVAPPASEEASVVVPPPPPLWWTQHPLAIAMVVALVVALAGWWIVSNMGLTPQEKTTETQKAVAPGPETPKAGAVKMNPNDGLPYIWIPPGEFQMGCSPGDGECREDEKPPHAVGISHGFWLGQTEVTVGAYKLFAVSVGVPMPAEPILGQTKLNAQWSDLEQPMVHVTWADAQSYCESWAKGRLPTEAEWERAARAGGTAARYADLDAIAWYSGNSEGRIQRVRRKQPSQWGSYDMLGSVWEWVSDWYQGDYYKTLSWPAVDPKGPLSGTSHVLRGGSWDNNSSVLRASVRFWARPDYRLVELGFRCVREVIP